MSPDITAISSKMQLVFLKSVQLVVIVITCVGYLLLLQFMFYFTCLGSALLLLFMTSRTGHSILGVETIVNVI